MFLYRNSVYYITDNRIKEKTNPTLSYKSINTLGIVPIVLVILTVET